MAKSINLKKNEKIEVTDFIELRWDTLDIYWDFNEKNNAVDNFLWWNFLQNNNYTLLDFDYSLSTKASKYKYKLIFSKDNHSCIEYMEGLTLNEYVTTKNTIRINWLAWALLWEKQIYHIIDTYFTPTTFKRLDIAWDIPKSISSIKSKFKKLKQAWSEIYGSQWQIQTYYIGKYQNKDNKYKLIRLYDKLVSIKLKWEQDLYKDHLTYKAVTRIEIELRIELCKNITWQQFKNKQFLQALFFTHLQKHTEIFSEIDFNKIIHIRPKKINSLDELTPDEILDSRYIKTFLGWSYNLKKAWVCPIRVLTENNLYFDDTMTDISLSTENWIFSLWDFNTQTNIHNTKNIFRKK